MIARVEPLTLTRRLVGPFDYAIGENGITAGSIVRVPFGRQVLDGVVVEIAQSSEVPAEKLLTPKSVRDETVPVDLVNLASWLADEYCSTRARALSLVLPPKGKKKTKLWARRSDLALEDQRLTPRQRDLLARLPAETGKELSALRRLEKRGLVEIYAQQSLRSPVALTTPDKQVALTDEQADVLEAIEQGGSYLLHGVTGSGKTEVYLRAAASAISKGKGVIILVPEIALTPQIVARFRARFGDTVALLHSALSEGERYDEWLRLRSGQARIAVGPRSAIFAPVSDLGLIVIDEEHDASYKHESDPRYDARWVAQERARCSGATLVCGSATPRPESWLELPHLKLSHRVDDRPLPPVQLIDMRGSHHPLHPETARALKQADKSIVLLNRRGWSNFLTCRSCAKVWECPQCDVTLVLHRSIGTLNCHHCGHREEVPQQCSDCGSLSVARYGAGTERLEEELTALLDIPVFRLDADTTSKKDSVIHLLTSFASAPRGLLLGTQMVAKGHDFPDVTLVVVIDADTTLRFPDFRSEERTFAMIAQVAGRAGRGPKGGQVLVQTTSPQAPAILAAAQHDTEGFLAEELARRATLDYPPYGYLVRIVCSAPINQLARDAAGTITNHLQDPSMGSGLTLQHQKDVYRHARPDPFVGRSTKVLGPASLFRLRGRYRYQIVVKTEDRQGSLAVIRAAVHDASRLREFRSVNFSVDVDPQ